MSLKLWHSFFGSKRKVATNKKPTRALRMEGLEQRQLMATLVGITVRNEVVTFDSAEPETIATKARISGVQRGETLIGIDHRPATGELYGVGDKGNLYTLDAYTGRATFKVTLTADPTDLTAPYTKLSGGFYGVDFNPAVDRLRVVNSLDQNLRINVDTGFTITDETIAFIAGDINAARNPLVAGAAYDNPDNDPSTATTLRGIEFGRDVLVTQNPANNGTLSTIGSLGVNVTGYVGFDIGVDGAAYAALQAPSRIAGPLSSLYSVDLATGAATRIGKIGKAELLRDLSAVLPSQRVYAATAGNHLISFHSARPDVLMSQLPIQGLAANETVRSLDFRPATGELYALGSSGRVYTIDTVTAIATFTPTTVNVTGNAGLDFNPVPDRLRITSDAEQNLRVNVDSGAITGDVALAYAAGDPHFGADPSIVASAYTNSFAGATATTLYGIDSSLDILVVQNPPNNGTLQTVGPLGIDAGTISSFDIASTGVAFAAIQLAGENVSRWYNISLVTGAATLIGTFAGGETVHGAAVVPAVVRFAAAAYNVRERDGQATIIALRSGDNTGSVSVNLSQAPGEQNPATEGVDYLAAAGLLTFAPGQTSSTVAITLISDKQNEGAETVDLFLTVPTGGGQATIGHPAQTRLVIR